MMLNLISRFSRWFFYTAKQPDDVGISSLLDDWFGQRVADGSFEIDDVVMEPRWPHHGWTASRRGRSSARARYLWSRLPMTAGRRSGADLR